MDRDNNSRNPRRGSRNSRAGDREQPRAPSQRSRAGRSRQPEYDYDYEDDYSTSFRRPSRGLNQPRQLQLPPRAASLHPTTAPRRNSKKRFPWKAVTLIVVCSLVFFGSWVFTSLNPQFQQFAICCSIKTQPISGVSTQSPFKTATAALIPSSCSKIAAPKPGGRYSVLGKPTICPDFITLALEHYHSPAAQYGSDLYRLGIKYGVDPVYALAFFFHESGFGTSGEARITLSLGNERCIKDRPCIDQDRGGYAKMNSWVDGFEHWYMLIVSDVYVASGLVTVDQIIPKYAPNSDGNNEKEYIATIKKYVDDYRRGIYIE